MHWKIGVLAGLFVFFGKTQTASAIAVNAGTLEDVASQDLFVPQGYDDNDEVVVVLDGYLPDTCYKMASPKIHRDYPKGEVTITATARRFSQGDCMDMLVPYTKVIKLGQMSKGSIKIITNKGELVAPLAIKSAPTTDPDDYVYAPINSAHIVKIGEGKFKAVLEGRFTNSCAKVKETKIGVTGNTIQVQPIMNTLLVPDDAGFPCKSGDFPFQTEIAIPELPNQGPHRFLLHVRSLDGQSVNQVFSRDASDL